MRAAFGLVGLLVTIGVIVWFWSIYHPADPVITGQQIRPEVEQYTGRGPDQQAAIGSFEVDGELEGGRLARLHVTDVAAGGAMEQYYGLQRGDRIVGIGAGGSIMPVSQFGDEDTAKALVHDAFRMRQPIIVIRGGQEIMLPDAAAGAAPGGPVLPDGRTLDVLQGVPTH